MSNASPELKLAIQQPARTLACKIEFGTYIQLTDADIISVEIKNHLCPTNEFEIGVAPMATATVEVKWSDDVDYDYTDKKAEIFFGIELEDETIEYVSMGFFTVEKAKVSKRNLTLNLSDNMYKSERDFEGIIQFPSTPLTILEEVCSQCGLTLANDNFVNANYTITKEVMFHDISCRTIIAQIAELAGGWAIINRDGELEIITLGQTAKRDITQSQYFEFDVDETANSNIDKVVVNVGEESASEGDGENLYHVVNNMFVQNPNLVVSSLYNVLNGTHFLVGSLPWQGDFTLDMGDLVTVEGEPFYILSRKFDYSGGLSERTVAPAVSNLLKDTNVRGSLTLAVRKNVSEIKILNDKIDLSVVQITTNTSKISNLTLGLDSVRMEVSALGGGNVISNILGTFGIHDWTFENPYWTFRSSSPYPQFNKGLLFAEDEESQIMVDVETDTLSEHGFRIFQQGKALSQFARAEGGAEYSLYTRYKGNGSVTFKLREYTSGTPTNKDNYQRESTFGTTQSSNNWATVAHTIELLASTNAIVLVVESNVNPRNQEYLTWTDSSVNMGNPRPYSESLTDINTKATYAVTVAETTAQGFNVLSQNMSLVEGRLSTAESSLSVQAGQISSKVSRDGVISSINQSPESISINASKINLTGYVTVSSLGAGGSTKVDGGNITTGTVSASRLAAGSITASKLATDSVTTVKIASEAITSTKISAGAVTATKLAANSVTASKISANAIDASKIQTNSITANRLSTIGGFTFGNSVMTSTSTGGYIRLSGATGYNVIQAGTSSSNINFLVTQTGIMSCTGANVTGTLRAGSVVQSSTVTANSSSSLAGSLNNTAGRHNGSHYGYLSSGSGYLGGVPFATDNGLRLSGIIRQSGAASTAGIIIAGTSSMHGNAYCFSNLTVSGNFYNNSDIYYKQKVVKTNEKKLVEDIYSLNIIEYEMKTEPDEKRIGVIANNVITNQQALSLYAVSPNDDGYLNVDYQVISNASILAIQDLNRRLMKLEEMTV